MLGVVGYHAGYYLSAACIGSPLFPSPLRTAWVRPFPPGFWMDSDEGGWTGDQEVGEASDWGIYSPCLLSQGQRRSLMGYSPWSWKEPDTTEQLTPYHLASYSCIKIWNVKRPEYDF